MPVYNAEKYLREAMDSILTQTFRDFEFLIINDGSTDSSKAIIRAYIDPRIRYVENETNIRLIATLNKGIELAMGEYIVRMDADDISEPQRIAKQVEFMDTHPQVGLCGSFMRTIGLERNYDIHYQTEHDAIKFRLFFDTHFPHPTAIIRKPVLMHHQLRFDKAYIHAEDFELWTRMADVCKIAILPEILVIKRSHAEQVSEVYKEIQEEITAKIRKEQIEKLGVHPSQKEIETYEWFIKKNIPKEKEALEALLDLFEKLVISNIQKDYYKPALFNRYFAEQYLEICMTSTHLGLWIFNKYKRSVFHLQNMSPSASLWRLFLKSLVQYRSR